MEWPGSQPNESHLLRIIQKGEVCCLAKPRAAVRLLIFTDDLFRLQHCSPSLFRRGARGLCRELITVECSDEEFALLLSCRNAKKQSKHRKKWRNTSLSHLTADRVDCKNHRGPPSGTPPLVNTSALCHDRFLFWCLYQAGLLAMSQWSRRQYWIIWFTSQSSILPLFLQRFLEYNWDSYLWKKMISCSQSNGLSFWEKHLRAES